jgi:hypothetical protein
MNNISKKAQSALVVFFGLITIYVIVGLWFYWWRFDFFGQRLFFDLEDIMRYFQLIQDHWYYSEIYTEYPPLALLFLYGGWFYGFIKNKKNFIVIFIWWAIIILIWYNIFTSFYSLQWWLWYLPFLIFLIESWQDAGLIIVYNILNYLQFPLLFNINPNVTIIMFTVGISTTLLIFIGLLIVKRLW